MSSKDDAKKIALRIRAFSLDLIDRDVESALILAKMYGQYLVFNHIGIFVDNEFENRFFQRFSFLLTDKFKKSEFEVLHLMTASYKSGGHTRVVERLLQGGLGDGLAILDLMPKEVREVIPNNVLVYEKLEQPSGIATIEKILEIGLKFKNVILHINPDDIYSAIASHLMARLGVKIYFYNHADHAFSFGYFSAERVFEISKYGWLRGEVRGIDEKQTFVGIPIPPLESKWKKNTQPAIFKGVFAGAKGKFFPWNQYDPVIFLNSFFLDNTNSNNVMFYICGSEGKEKHWQRLSKLTREKVEFVGVKNHSEYLKFILSSDFYVDSFPQPNGTGFVESVMLGIPSFGLSVLAGYSPSDVLRSHSISDLTRKISQYIDGDFNFKSISDARKVIISTQSVDVCISRIKLAISDGELIPLPKYIQKMKCIDNFHEKLWELNKEIKIPIRSITKLSLFKKIQFLKCLSGTLPFCPSWYILRRLLKKF